MITNSKTSSVEIIKRALSERKNNNIDIKNSFCVFDFAEKNNIEVKFVDISSMEGFLILGKKQVILISSHRPPPRQRFTCAHELGHLFYKHQGIHIDEIETPFPSTTSYKAPDEKVADQFAAFLLMPPSTVMSGFSKRKIRLQKATPIEIYTIAAWLGVGYTTLITHLQFGLKKISNFQAQELKKISPKEIKKLILGFYCHNNVVPVDFQWSGRPIDTSLGDYLVFNKQIQFNDSKLEYIDKNNGHFFYRTKSTGIGQVWEEKRQWSSFVRISRENYIGRCKFRHLEED